MKERSERINLDLSRRQLQVARLLGRGLSNREIAEVLELHPGTINHHMVNIYSRLGVRRRVDAVRALIRLGIIEP